MTQENPTCRQCGKNIDAPPYQRAGGECCCETLRQIYWGALLHDVGKIGIPDATLLKPGPLTQAEQGLMRTHPEKGHAILAGIPFLQDAAQIVLSHEERFDGRGYPRGLAREAIPRRSRPSSQRSACCARWWR